MYVYLKNEPEFKVTISIFFAIQLKASFDLKSSQETDAKQLRL